jgi:hypothetical protein
MISAGMKVLTNSGDNNSWLSNPDTTNLLFAEMEYSKFKEALIDLIDEIDGGWKFQPNQVKTWSEILDDFVNDLRLNPSSLEFFKFFH